MTRQTTLAAYARHLQRRGLAPSTCRAYLAVARRFLVHLGCPITRARKRDIESYLAMRSEHLSAATHGDEHYKLRAFLRALLLLDIIHKDPAAGIKVKRAPYGVPLLLSEQSIARLLRAASQDNARDARALRDRALIEVAFGVGLRASEIAAVKAVDLNLKEGSLLVHRVKRGGQALLPLPPSCVEHLRRYLNDARPALVAQGRHRDRGHLLLSNVGTPLTGKRVAEIVARAAKRARRRAHPHALRRALASQLIAQGASVTAVQELLGHARLDTTARYIEVDRESLRRAVAIIDRSR